MPLSIRLMFTYPIGQVKQLGILKELIFESCDKLNFYEILTTAFYWEGDEIGDERRVTYGELHQLVCQFSNFLLRQGLKPGDTVALYLPTCIEAAAAMQVIP